MQTILITGVTDGIGLELTKLYLAEGRRVIGVGRSPAGTPEINALLGSNYCEADLRHPNAPKIILDFLNVNRISQLDALVNNAALGWYGNVSEQSEASINDLLTVNVYAPIALTHALLPLLITAHGCVAFVSSVHSVIPTPDFSVYTATKAALDGFARNLRIELRNKVDVLTVWPGPTRTSMHLKSGMPVNKIKSERYASPSHAATVIAAALEQRRSTALSGANTLFRWAAQRFEGLLDRAMIATAKRKTI